MSEEPQRVFGATVRQAGLHLSLRRRPEPLPLSCGIDGGRCSDKNLVHSLGTLGCETQCFVRDSSASTLNSRQIVKKPRWIASATPARTAGIVWSEEL